MDDNSIITFGKYRGKKISTLSTSYLMGLYGSLKHTHELDLIKYLEKHLNILQVPKEVEKPSIIIVKQLQNRQQMFCTVENKIMYISEKDAKSELKRIANTNSEKKPIRSYECDSCGGFHLTSKLSKHQLKFTNL